MPALRIVSLIASATEIVCALGLRDRLVGRSHECDYPEGVLELPAVSEPKLDVSQPSGAIDAAVRGIVADGLSVYRVDTDILARLAPDLIVTQDHCEVCAVSLKDVEGACAELVGSNIQICSLRPHCLADVERDFGRVADAAGVSDRGAGLVGRFRSQLDSVSAKVAGAPRPKVALIEWLDPPMVAGGWMPELARIAGGEPVIVTDAHRFETVDYDAIDRADPDFVVVMPCGFDVPRTLEELRVERIAAPVRALRATREGRTFVADGNALFNRPGPRLSESAEVLGSILHPDRVTSSDDWVTKWGG